MKLVLLSTVVLLVVVFVPVKGNTGSDFHDPRNVHNKE